MKICSNCGASNTDAAKFCIECGTAQGATTPTKPPTVPSTAPASIPPTKPLSPTEINAYGLAHSLSSRLEALQGKRRADIMFVLDCTGSMGGEIEAIKDAIMDFADTIESDGVRVRVGLVEFRDRSFKKNTASSLLTVNLSQTIPQLFVVKSPNCEQMAVAMNPKAALMLSYLLCVNLLQNKVAKSSFW